MGERIAFEDLTSELASVRNAVETWAYNKMVVADDSLAAFHRNSVDKKGTFASCLNIIYLQSCTHIFCLCSSSTKVGEHI
jgi:hypothetical protein